MKHIARIALSLLLIPALSFTGCASKDIPVITSNSPAGVVGQDLSTAAKQAFDAFAEYSAGNTDLTWALSKAFTAYGDITKTAPDVKALLKVWTGSAGQKLQDRIALLFATSSGTPVQKMATLAQASLEVATAKTTP